LLDRKISDLSKKKAINLVSVEITLYLTSNFVSKTKVIS
jgi:hypothetical protein